jgi:hypothetical protein
MSELVAVTPLLIGYRYQDDSVDSFRTALAGATSASVAPANALTSPRTAVRG